MSFEDIGASAVEKALADAQVNFDQIGSAFCSSMIGPIGGGHKVLSKFGIYGIPIVNIENACAGGGTCLRMAVDAIRAGRTDMVMALGVEKMPHGFIEMDIWPNGWRLRD